MSVQTVRSCDNCKRTIPESNDNSVETYYVGIKRAFYLDHEQTSFDLCSVACLREWADKWRR